MQALEEAMTNRCVVLGVLLGVAAGAGPAEGQAPPREDAWRAVADVAGAAAERGFAGQVLAVRDGERLFYESFGLADADARTPVTGETVFAIGSVTKQFTRVAVLLLEERGLLSRSDPISRHLDGMPADKADITVGQLLDMRAGFHEHHDDTGDHQAMTRDEALARIYAQDLLFEPGSERAYSNSGYTLLAAIVEEVSGTGFETFVRRELLDPHGLDRIGFHGDGRWEDDAVAHGRNGLAYGDNAPSSWPSTTWALMGAGGMVASAADMERWIGALRGGDVLGPEALALAYRPDGTALYAGGDDYGFTTGIVELDHGNDFVVVTTNSAYESLGLALEVAEAMNGEPPPIEVPRREVATDEGPGEGPGGGILDSPRGRRIASVMSALEDGSETALRRLVEEDFSPAMRDAFPMDDHLSMLGEISARVRAASRVGASPIAEWEVEIVADDTVIVVSLDPADPHLVSGIRVGG